MSEIGAVGGILSSPSATAAATSAAASVLTNPAVHAATRAALELVVSSALGVVSIDRGLLNAATVKALSRATFTILLPMLLGTSILKTITTYGLTKSSLAVPVLAACQSLLLYGFTNRVLYPLFLRPEERNTDHARGTAVCASFGNGGTVPLIFCDSLFRRASATNKNNDNLELSTGFVSMFLVGWSPFFWSFGRSVLLGGGDNISSNGAKRIRAKGAASSPSTRKEELISLVKIFLPPPVMGVLVGMVIAIAPILRRLFVGDEGLSSSSTTKPAILGVVFDTAQNFGKAASPLSLLVLVSSLALGAGYGKQHESPQPLLKDAGDSDSITIPFWKRWALVSFSRFVVSPALMFGLLKVASSPIPFSSGKSTWIGTSLEQPMLWFVCLLESCMPPAQNQVVMLQVANKMRQANEMAFFLFSVYATSMIPLTILISIALDKFGLI